MLIRCTFQVNDCIVLQTHYQKWLQAVDNNTNTNRFFFCNFPFIFDARAKTALLEVDQILRMQRAMQDAHMELTVRQFFVPVDPSEVFFNLHVSREKIVHDTLTQIMSAPVAHVRKPLKVQFLGEEAEDAGGVRKEFFLLLMREILNPNFGMFKEYEDSHHIWFNRYLFEEDISMFHMIGVICGLAIYNFTIINLPFPLVLYKKLLDENKKYKATLDDLDDLSPSLAKGLKDVLAYEGEDLEDVFCLNFSISEQSVGMTMTENLIKDGADVAVTQSNKQEYVDLYCDYIINSGIAKQYDAFQAGFHRVIVIILLVLILYKTGVINDPFGQTHSPARSYNNVDLKIVLFCAIFKSWDRLMDGDMCENNDYYWL